MNTYIYLRKNYSKLSCHFPAIIRITFGNRTIVNFKANFVASKI